jgi:hypothetical protein
MKTQRRFAPTGGQFAPESVARFTGIRTFRKKRNISDYERSGAVSSQEADEMFVLAKMLRKSVGDWLERSYPKLLSD